MAQLDTCVIIQQVCFECTGGNVENTSMCSSLPIFLPTCIYYWVNRYYPKLIFSYYQWSGSIYPLYIIYPYTCIYIYHTIYIYSSWTQQNITTIVPRQGKHQIIPVENVYLVCQLLIYTFPEFIVTLIQSCRCCLPLFYL